MFPSWTLDQIDDAPHVMLERLLQCDRISSEISAEEHDKARRKAEAARSQAVR